MAAPRTVHPVTVFVASPNDMQPFRTALEKVVRNLNRNFLANDTRELDLLTAQKNVPASYGADAQFLINEGIGDQYDFIVVILGARVGTATPRDIAGTIEEFNRARKRFEQTGSPMIMVYFCTAPKNPHDLDPEQLSMVHEFRSQMIEHRSFYKFFKTKKEFEDTLESDMQMHLNAHKDRSRTVSASDAKVDI